MSTQDAVDTGNRKTTSRRVKFGATLEDLEGRVLLSAVHHVPLHRRGSCAGAAGPPRKTCQPRTDGHADANDAGQRAHERATCQGDCHGDHQRAADDHYPARDQRSAQRERRDRKHTERIEYVGEHQPDLSHTGRLDFGITELRRHQRARRLRIGGRPCWQ